MDGFSPLSLEEDQTMAVVPAAQAGEWAAVQVGGSAMVIWFPHDAD